MHFVIARYLEDISWADKINKTVIQKGVDMPNIGREPSSYILFILNNYEKLEGEYVFCQGNPFDHEPNFLQAVHNKNYYGVPHTCNLDGSPHHGGLPIVPILNHFKIPLPSKIEFNAGCQFKLTAEEIREIPYNTYSKLYASLTVDDIICYVFERMPKLLFKQLK